MTRHFLPFTGSLILAALVVALAFALSGRLSGSWPSPRPISGVPNSTSARSSALTLPTPNSSEYYAAITDRPLFSPTRRTVKREPTPEPPIATAPAQIVPPSRDIPLPDLQLFGTLDTGRNTSALIAETGETPAWVGIGVAVGGWTIAAIGPDWVDLAHEDKKLRLEMYPR